MPTLSIATAIENINDPEELRVLAVINHLAPIAEVWRKAENLRLQLKATQQSGAAAREAINEAKSELIDARTDHEAVFTKLTSYGYLSLALLPLSIVSGIASLFFAMPKLPHLAITLLIIGITAAFISARTKRKATYATMAQKEQKVAQAQTNVDMLSSEQAKLEEHIAKRSTIFPEIRLALLRFPFRIATIAGRTLLLDASGIHKETVFKAVDASEMQDVVTEISDKVSSLNNIPPLLSPDHLPEDSASDGRLFGEERVLQELVGKFTLSLGKLKDVNLALPIVDRKSILISRLESGNLTPASSDTQIEITTNTKSSAEITLFANEIQKNREQAERVFKELGYVFQSLVRTCTIYAEARTTSINTIHEGLTAVLNRASWCNRKFYCPRTIMSPTYIQDLIGVNPQTAYELSLDDLITRLQSDEEIAKRLASKPELEQQLTDAYYQVQNFAPSSFEQDNTNSSTNRPRHFEDQFRECQKHFRAILQKVLTGSSYPVLNFSAEAQVYFDPTTDQWGSDLVPYTYTTNDVLRYGGIVKAYSDIMVPLWEHLWAEKADFRKSELFRTNESMILMSEKESEKLIDVGNQYRADMRSVREHLNLLNAETKAKFDEIISFRNSMDSLGLLSDHAKETVSDQKLANLVLGDPVLKKSEHYETLLNTWPQTQAENRGTVHDPVTAIREPDALIGYKLQTGARLLTE